MTGRSTVARLSSVAPSTAPGADLRAYAEQLIARASTGSTLDVDVRAAVSLALKVRCNATRASQERSQRIQAAVWAEDVPATRLPMPMKRRAWIVTNGIGCRREQHELERLPSDRIVRHYLRLKDKAATVAPSPEATRDSASTEVSQQRGGEHGCRDSEEGQRIIG